MDKAENGRWNMSKKDFLEQLEDALAGEVSNAVVYDNKQYYERYIDSEIRKGRTEQDILDALGNPRLIAKTIIDMQASGSGSYYDESTVYKEDFDENLKGEAPGMHSWRFDLNTWYGKLLTSVAAIFFVLLLIWIVTGIFSVILVVAGPVLIILGIAYIIKKIIGK